MDNTEPYTLDKLDVAALRKADYVSVSLMNGEGKVRAIKRIEKTERNPFATDAEHYIAAPVRIYCGYRYETRNPQCHALVYLYQSQKTPATSIINTLQAGDSIRFEFYPDRFRTQAMQQKSTFHADALMLKVYDKTGKLKADWELHLSVCEDNSARMCRGIYEKPEFADA
jgi:hypothetical protein